jgi:hypothetical protein
VRDGNNAQQQSTHKGARKENFHGVSLRFTAVKVLMAHNTHTKTKVAR